MKEFLVLSLVGPIFVFNAFCMIPSSWLPPPPTDVVFDDCFFVPEITGLALFNEVYYSHRHVCRQGFPTGGPQPREHEINWFLVGSLRNVRTRSHDLQLYNYVQFKQSHVRFVYLKQTVVEFKLRSSIEGYKITFQSVQQRQAFYEMIYHQAHLSRAAPNEIDVFHEITNQGNRKLGNNVQALCERINDVWHITLRNEQGEPILIFSQSEALITGMKRSLINQRQVLLKAHGTFYILTFSSYTEAKQFSDALLDYLDKLYLNSLDLGVKNRFKFNQIMLNS